MLVLPSRMAPASRSRGGDCRVALRDEVQASQRAAGGNDAFGIERVFERHRDAVQRTYVVAARYGGVGGSGLVEGALGALHDDGVEASVHLIDAVKVGLRDFDG